MRARGLALALLALGSVAAPVAIVWGILAALWDPHGTRARRVTVGFDQLANAAFGGDEDETISSRAGRAQIEGKRWACILCRVLGWFERDHCRRSIE